MRCVVCVCSLLVGPALGAAETPPAAVQIQSFQSRHVINAPGAMVRLAACLVRAAAPDAPALPVAAVLDVHVGVHKPRKAAERKLALKPGLTRLEFAWKPDDVRFGVLAELRLTGPDGHVLASARTQFEVADDWTRVLRLATIETYKLARAQTPAEAIERLVRRARAAGVNGVNCFAWMPASYDLTPETPDWPDYSGRDPKTRRTTAEKLKLWSRLLHANGMRFILYNETSAFRGDEAAKLRNPHVRPFDPDNVLAAYYRELGYFTPNCLRVGDLFGRELAGSIRLFDWDAVMMDSASQAMQATHVGLDREGKRVTTLSPGEIGRRYITAARRHVDQVKPSFRFISQNIQASIIGRYYRDKRPLPAIFPTVERFYAQEQWARYSEVVDMWTSESTFDAMRDGGYAGTYDRLAVALNTAVELTRKPLLVWMNLAGPANRTVSYVKPLLATVLASRSTFNEHYEMYGGATTGPARDPVNAAIRQYRRFAQRYGQYLFDPELRWQREPWTWVATYRTPTSMMWEHTVYARPLPNGGRRIVVHLLNLPANRRITDRHKTPKRVANCVVSLKLDGPRRPVKAWLLPADGPPEANYPGLAARAPTDPKQDPIALAVHNGAPHERLAAGPGQWSVSVNLHAGRNTSPEYWSVLVVEVEPAADQ